MCKYKWVVSALIITVSCNSPQNILQRKQKAFQKSSHQNVKVYESASGLGPCEPSIYINPENPKQIVAGSVLDNVHYSHDGGITWHTNKLTSSLGVWGDPCIVADQDGVFYYLHLSDPEGTNWKSKNILDQIVIQRSEDGGKTWSEGKGIGKNTPKQQDKEWAAVHPGTGALAVTWTEFDRYRSTDPDDKTRIRFSYSKDKGETWTPAISISELEGNTNDDDRTVEGAVPAIAANGDIYVAWSYDEKIYFDKSTDEGKTWLQHDIVAADQPGGWSLSIPGLGRSNGMPITCVDNSNSAHRGTIYINWTDQRNGSDNTDVFITSSKDGGRTWSPAFKVNTDDTRTHQFLSWMSVDAKTGFVYIVYYDRSRQNDNATEVSLAVSYDGGKSFTSKIISNTPFTPVKDGVFFGDYNNIHAFNGLVRPVWTRYENGKLSIWTALISDR
ncbi:sialidase family protein [Ascidiimonas aurantiaca]|uniref:sialidase family protein n=1 Tax=Ascidiimonas aurantiaca TaxID=1685432 RepID=UPI0030ED91A5